MLTRRLLRFLLAMPLGLVASCSPFAAEPSPADDTRQVETTKGAGPTSPTDPSRDAGSDFAERSDSGSATGPLVVDGFESLSTCGSWAPIRGALKTVADGAHGSARSCQACVTDVRGGGASRIIRPRVSGTALFRGIYTFTVHVRSAAYAGEVKLDVCKLQPDGTRGSFVTGAWVDLSTKWAIVQLQTDLDGAAEGWWVDLYESPLRDASNTLKNTCFQFDGLSVDYLAAP